VPLLPQSPRHDLPSRPARGLLQLEVSRLPRDRGPRTIASPATCARACPTTSTT
jgi:hypothetical protein